MAPRKKKEDRFTILDIQEDYKKYDLKKKVNFDNNKHTEIYLHFKPTTIDALLDDLTSFIIEYEKTGRKLKDKEIENYIALHAILYFSTIIETMPTDIFEKIDLFEQMLNNKYCKKIAESFDPEEMSKITETMMDKANGFVKLLEKDKELKDKFKEQFDAMELENKDLVRTALFGDESNGEERIQ